MLKFLLFFFIFLLLSFSVFATNFSSDTTFTEDNIVYVFKKGVSVDDFSIYPGGININTDNKNNKLSFITEGGKLVVTFYQFSNDSRRIGFNSSIPQTLGFQIFVNGVKQYLFDGNSYYLNSFNIGSNSQVIFDLVSFSINNFTTNPDSVIVPQSDITNLPWFKEKLVEFEVSKSINSNGIISGDSFAITYLGFILVMLVLVLGFLWWFR